uniref:Putative ovule protein n=1 Tax=Solanum chacoense TaxID=4108 RepID=A0A0V0HJV6_SOLCH
MGDQIQHQLAQLVNLFQEERAANLARHEATNARLDALTHDLVNSKVDSESTEHISQNRGWKGKNRVAGGSGSETGGSFTIPRHTKLDFPRFNGQEDPLGWLNGCEHFFRHQQTLEEEKVGLASFHLEGNAQLWFLQLETDLPQLSWDDFKRHCNLRFGPPIRSQKLGELAKLRQIGSVADYQKTF